MFKVEVSLPQLDGVLPFLTTFGGQMMADFSLLHADLAALRTAIQTEGAQVAAKLQELADVLAADALDSTEIATARSLVAEMLPMVHGMVPDAPPAP